MNAIDECELTEPIYGIDSLEDGEDVLITEGIADAITAHEAGYACLSPVTTSFKLGDRERLVDLLADASVSRVYVERRRTRDDVPSRSRRGRGMGAATHRAVR